MSRAKGKRWPDLISSCVKCSSHKDKVAYSRRGLCVSCEKVERRAGRVKSWPKIGRDKEKHSTAATRYTKDNYWRRKRARVIYTVVSSIGITEASERLGVDREEIRNWMNGANIPEDFIERVTDLKDKITTLTTQANSNLREEELFKSRGSHIRIFDGKIFE